MFAAVISTLGWQKESELRRWVISDLAGNEVGRRMKAGEGEEVGF